MAGTTGGVKAAEDTAQQAALEVKEAESRLAGGGSVTFDALHKLRDRWRHADLAAQGAQARAQAERQVARLDGLAAVGAQVDKAAAAAPGKAMKAALEEVAAACAKVRALAEGHDAGVAALVATAVELGVEPTAPAGPRATSAHVAVDGDAVTHKRTRLVPVRDKVGAALPYALAGDVAKAAEIVRPVVEVPEAQRPEYVLRGRNGLLQPVGAPLNSGMQALIRSGEVVLLSEVDIDRWMAGELA